jgi:hypothetical protein
MASQLFSDILDGIRDSARHLGQGDFTVLAIVAGAIVVAGVLIFRR